jgi:hypothetical protein
MNTIESPSRREKHMTVKSKEQVLLSTNGIKVSKFAGESFCLQAGNVSVVLSSDEARGIANAILGQTQGEEGEVRASAVEAFLKDMDTTEPFTSHISNLARKSEQYRWNEPTVQAITDKIVLAYQK